MKTEEVLKIIKIKGVLNPQILWEEHPEEKAAVIKLVENLVEQGEIVRLSKGRVASLESANYVKGEVQIKKDGYGFVRNGGGDIFVAGKNLNGAFSGEIVLVKVIKSTSKGKEGRVERVISPLPYMTVGTYKSAKKGDYVISDTLANGKISILRKHEEKKAHNKKVVLAVTKRAYGSLPPQGYVTEVLGTKGAPGIDILSVARGFGLQAGFPEKTEKEAEAISEEVSQKELASRELLFGKKVFTIDGEDAKDLDDAVSIEQLNNQNFLLGVHIADVSHYVALGGELDKEAYKRGTSVYLVDEVIPMLPKRLSNGICSLNEKVNRLTLSCFMEVDREGKVVAHRFAKTAIRSCHRLNYSEINRLLEEGDASAKEKYADIAEDLFQMRDLARIIREARVKKGSIDFDIPEAKIKLDGNRRPVEIIPRVQRTAENLIEEFMVLCNNTVAEEFFQAGAPFLYRIHEKPDAEKMKELSIFLSTFGYRRVGNSNKELQKVLKKSVGTPAENIIKTVTLRSMRKAVYSADNRGHFGLASSAYTHFTSPIRRYPDLVVHRLLSGRIRGKKDEYRNLQEVADHCSARERNAIEAERQIDDIKKAEYMQTRVGEYFQGIVSGVTSAVLFVELPDTVEGVLPLSEIKEDYYVFYKELYCVIGRRTKKKISLGDTIEVRVKSVDTELPRIEFATVAVPRKKKK